MSAPAAKARSEPVRSKTRMSEEDDIERRAEFSSVIRGVESAFKALGRLRVTENKLEICNSDEYEA